MTPTQHALRLQKEGRISLAIASLRNRPHLSHRGIAAAYNIPRSTLETRLQGICPQHDTRSVHCRLLEAEEQALVEWILDLDRRGFPPQIIDVRRMADNL